MTSHTPPTADLGALLADGLAAAARGDDAMLLRATVRLLWQERTDGHVCLSLADWQERSVESDGPPFPAAAAWAEALRATGLCGEAGAGDDPADGTPLLPLVLDHHRLYLRRDFAAERTIVRSVQRRISPTPPPPRDRPRTHSVPRPAMAEIAPCRDSDCPAFGPWSHLGTCAPPP